MFGLSTFITILDDEYKEKTFNLLGVKHGGYMSNNTGKGLKSHNTKRVY